MGKKKPKSKPTASKAANTLAVPHQSASAHHSKTDPIGNIQIKVPSFPHTANATHVTVSHPNILPKEYGTNFGIPPPEDIKKQEQAKDYSGEWGKRVYCEKHYISQLPLLMIFIITGRFPFTYRKQLDGTYLYKFRATRPMAIYFFFMTALFSFVLIAGVINSALIIVYTDKEESDTVVTTEGLSLQETTTEELLNTTSTDRTTTTMMTTTTPTTENTTANQDNQSTTLPPTIEGSTKDEDHLKGYEEVLIRRYYIPLIYVYSSLLHGFIAAAIMIRRRHYIAHYLTFWSKAIYTMHMDVSRAAHNFSVRVCLVIGLTIISLVLLAVFKIGPTCVGLPMMFGDLTFRIFLFQFQSDGSWLQNNTNARKIILVAGGVLMIFVFTSSKSSIIYFIYHCKLLKSAFAFWNGRVYAAVLRGGEFAQTEEGRTTYKLLFKDHCVLMDLVEGLDNVFAHSLESYFGCQLFSLFFELYYCIRTAKHGDNRSNAAYPKPGEMAYFIRPYDWAPAAIMILLSLTLIVSAIKSAASVAEEAMAGLEVLRRRTMLGRKSDEELYFMLSMFSSYTAYKKMEISGGGYSYLNKDFLIGIISNALSYFIILYQFQPVLDHHFDGKRDRSERFKYGKFLAEIEGLVEDHYETTPYPGDLWEKFRF